MNGSLLWGRQAKAGYYMSPQVLVDGVYYTLEGGKAFAVDGAEGKELKAYPSPDSGGWLWLAVENGTLYGLTRGSLNFKGPLGEFFYAINPKDGSVIWKHQSKYPVDMRSACLGEGLLYSCSLGVQGQGV